MRACGYLGGSAVAAAMVAALASTAFAQATAPFDGTWRVRLPAAGSAYQTAAATCPALQMNVEIKDNQVTGHLVRLPTSTGALVVQSGQGPASADVTGTVDPSGQVSAQWMNYHASGMLQGDKGKITVIGDQCGLRDGTVTKIK